MLLLGIDTSGKTASTALLDTESEIILAQNTIYTQKTHSQVIMPICKELISQSGKKMSDIGYIAVANGPGSYTGLRIGVAAVKAMCFALDCKCSGISTLEGLAYNNVIFKGNICSIIKARGNLVYTCTYKSNGYHLEPIEKEEIISTDALAEMLALKNEETLLCGDGASDFFTLYRSNSFIIAPPYSRIQSASGICLAALSKEYITADELEISYLQKVKAEKELEEKSLM